MELRHNAASFFLLLGTAWAETHRDSYEIIQNKILKTAQPLASATVRSHIECAKLCTELHWKCFGANVRRLTGSGGGDRYLCEAFWVTLPDLSWLEDSAGDLYLNPGRANLWTDPGTGLEHLSSTCSMCICREAGCEKNLDTCFVKYNQQVCGPYAITKGFWCDGLYKASCRDAPQTDYENCTKTMECSRVAFAGYLGRYEALCAGAEVPTCRHYTLIVFSGPWSCSSPSAVGLLYWDRVNLCCKNHKGC